MPLHEGVAATIGSCVGHAAAAARRARAAVAERVGLVEEHDDAAVAQAPACAACGTGSSP